MLLNFLSEADMQEAYFRKDASFDGQFFIARLFSGEFCAPSCGISVRKKEQVLFFASACEALEKGYRPCKVCQPICSGRQAPAYIKEVVGALDKDPFYQFPKELREGPASVPLEMARQWFTKNHAMGLEGYRKFLQINYAFEPKAESSFDLETGDLGQFCEQVPQAENTTGSLFLKRILTPLGLMVIGALAQGVCIVEFAQCKNLGRELQELAVKSNAQLKEGAHAMIEKTEHQLLAYFAGKLKIFDIPLVVFGTDFQKATWKQLQTVPYGATTTYKEEAAAMGRPKAIRAVASANGNNRLAIVIPCHRVVGSNGGLTGYAGGVWRKNYLLELEAKYL